MLFALRYLVRSNAYGSLNNWVRKETSILVHIFTEDTALLFIKCPMEFGFCLMKCDVWPL